MSEEYRKICGLCNKGILIKLTGDILCEENGLMNEDDTCRNFEINYLRIQPGRRRKPKEKEFSPEDFSIE